MAGTGIVPALTGVVALQQLFSFTHRRIWDGGRDVGRIDRYHIQLPHRLYKGAVNKGEVNNAGNFGFLYRTP